ncbi:MAG: hypothetical protein GY719_08335 [bacterium]|nr:hypothetical protein [bacterium]
MLRSEMNPLRDFTRLSWALVVALLAAAPLSAGQTAFRIYTEAPGAYRVDHAALVAAGLDQSELPSAGLALTNLGDPVPIWIEDGGDGVFSAGDYLELVAEHLVGEDAYFHEHSRFNVYRLRLDAETGARMTPRTGAAVTDTPRLPLRRNLHLEREELLLRLSGNEIRRTDNSEAWYWAKLTHIDRQPFSVELNLDDVAPTGGPVILRAHFRGLSLQRRPIPDFPDHVVEISLDGEPIGRAEWAGRDLHTEKLEISATRLGGGPHRLEMRVPKRIPVGSDDPIVDALALNWIEIAFPSSGAWGSGMRRFEPTEPADGSVVELGAPAGGGMPVVYASNGDRIGPAASTEGLRFESTTADAWYLAAESDRLLEPGRIEPDRPSDLLATDRRADYLMIVHQRLRAELEPLAEFHRERGLDVEVVDVQDIYDELNHGVLHPRAIHDFIAHAYHRWRRPAPLFVLLVGDASWDSKHDTVDDANYANWTQKQLFDGDRFVARDTPVVPGDANQRNLIPTWNYHTGHGHSASDNYFVSVDGENHIPDLAIGRFPVTEPEEVRSIVAKTISYAANPPVGPWRRDVLWITNDHKSFQQRSDALATVLEGRGFGSLKVYPQAADRDNERHQVDLQAAFDRGTSLVHFYGHGGRHIWRTGPPDYRKNHDLFTLEHIDALEPHGRLPVVLSMTCFSAPFDHPNADSIGEKFLRVADRGAVAVLGASWRNSPSPRFSEALLDELLIPGTPIGIAIQRAKKTIGNRTLVETYNLLGDPAVPLALPAGIVELTALVGGETPAVTAALDLPAFAGRAIVDWLDVAGEVLRSDTLDVGETFAASYSGDGTPETVRVYAWDEEAGVDAIGALRLDPGPAADAAGR